MNSEPLVFLPDMMCDARLFAPRVDGLSHGRSVMVAPVHLGERVEEIASMILDLTPHRFVLWACVRWQCYFGNFEACAQSHGPPVFDCGQSYGRNSDTGGQKGALDHRGTHEAVGTGHPRGVGAKAPSGDTI